MKSVNPHWWAGKPPNKSESPKTLTCPNNFEGVMARKLRPNNPPPPEERDTAWRRLRPTLTFQNPKSAGLKDSKSLKPNLRPNLISNLKSKAKSQTLETRPNGSHLGTCPTSALQRVPSRCAFCRLQNCPIAGSVCQYPAVLINLGASQLGVPSATSSAFSVEHQLNPFGVKVLIRAIFVMVVIIAIVSLILYINILQCQCRSGGQQWELFPGPLAKDPQAAPATGG